MTDLPAFFRLIQPQEGWRCLFVLPDKRHLWFDDPEKMATAALALDAQGKAVFHGNATFKSKQRKADNVREISCIWFDIDAGPGKPYGSVQDAYRALEAWRQRVGFPAGLVVASGGGLHIYWPLRVALDRAQWADLSARLRALAHEHGLHIDPGSTIDAARILRPPGTHNRKLLDVDGRKLDETSGPPRLVRCGPLVGPYDISDLFPDFTTSGIAAPPQSDTIAKLSPLQGHGDAALLNIDSNGPDQAADPNAIARECAQVRRLRDAHGRLPEPEWYAVLGVLAHGGPGSRAAAHTWSSGDERYVPADTDRKLDQARRAAGPTTCDRFVALNPAVCAGCRHWRHVASPLQIGRPGHRLPVGPPPPQPGKLDLPVIPDPFYWAKGRLMIKVPAKGKAAAKDLTIVNYPVTLSQLQKGERSDGVSAVFRSWEPMRQGWTEFTVPLKAACGDRGSAELAHQGVVVLKRRWSHFADYLVRCANIHRGQRHYGTRYDQFGWKPDGFVLGETLLQADGAARVHGSPEIARRGKLMVAEGDAAAWTAATDRLFGQAGLEAQQFMVLCGFAAPLYRFTGEVGGTIVHAQSTATGTGKSTALDTISWIWGEREATQTIQADTLVAKFISFGVLCHLPIVYDELRTPDVDALKDTVLQFSLGRDKQRGAAEGGLRGDALPWSTILISASNLSLVDAVRSDGGEKAHAARVFEFPVDLPAETRREDAADLKRAIEANRGSAGRAYAEVLLQRRAWLEAAVPAMLRGLEQQLGDGPEMRYVVRLLAAVAVAGRVCREAGLLGFDMGRIMAWAVSLARRNQEKLDSDRSGDLASVVGALINDMQPHTLVVRTAAKPGPKSSVPAAERYPSGALKARFELDSRLWECDVRAVRDWMLKAHQPFSDIERQLEAAGALKRAGIQKTLSRGSTLPGTQVRVWEIDGHHPLVCEALEDLTAPVESNVVPLRAKP